MVNSNGTYPARDPPIHAIVAGVKAGDFPALALARLVVGGGGAGLLRIAKYGINGRSAAYRPCVDGRGLCGLPVGVTDPCIGFGEIARMSSACNRGMKPGSIAVPPTMTMPDAKALRRSTGTYRVYRLI